MQLTIGELRAERHRFANEAMRAIALERRLQKIASERDLMRLELEEYRSRCTCEGSECSRSAKTATQSAKPAPACPGERSPRKNQSIPRRIARIEPVTGRAFIPIGVRRTRGTQRTSVSAPEGTSSGSRTRARVRGRPSGI